MSGTLTFVDMKISNQPHAACFFESTSCDAESFYVPLCLEDEKC